MVEIRPYSISNLRQLLSVCPWFSGDPVPITRERALSQVNNPRAEESDVVLLAAYDGDRVVAHLGILPDLAFVGTAKRKIGWLTAWWADPDRKYSGVGMLLMMRAMALYRDGIGASGFSEDAKKVYAATRKFTTLKEAAGVSAFVRFDANRLMVKRFPWLDKVQFLLKCGDAIANGFIALRQAFWKAKHPIPAGVRFEIATELDAQAARYISEHNARELFQRGGREWNWIGRFPWLTKVPPSESPKFRFSTTALEIRSDYLSVRDSQGRLVAVLMVTVVDGHLIVPFFHHDDNDAELAAKVLFHYVADKRIKRMTIFRAGILAAFDQMRFPRVWSSERRRSWILSNASAMAGAEYSFQDGDGDCAFTL